MLDADSNVLETRPRLSNVSGGMTNAQALIVKCHNIVGTRKCHNIVEPDKGRIPQGATEGARRATGVSP